MNGCHDPKGIIFEEQRWRPRLLLIGCSLNRTLQPAKKNKETVDTIIPECTRSQIFSPWNEDNRTLYEHSQKTMSSLSPRKPIQRIGKVFGNLRKSACCSLSQEQPVDDPTSTPMPDANLPPSADAGDLCETDVEDSTRGSSSSARGFMEDEEGDAADEGAECDDHFPSPRSMGMSKTTSANPEATQNRREAMRRLDSWLFLSGDTLQFDSNGAPVISPVVRTRKGHSQESTTSTAAVKRNTRSAPQCRGRRLGREDSWLSMTIPTDK